MAETHYKASIEGWIEYRKLILSQLTDLQVNLSALRKEVEQFRQEDIAEIKIEIALLKLKTSIWAGTIGALSGLIVTTGAILLRIVH